MACTRLVQNIKNRLAGKYIYINQYQNVCPTLKLMNMAFRQMPAIGEEQHILASVAILRNRTTLCPSHEPLAVEVSQKK